MSNDEIAEVQRTVRALEKRVSEIESLLKRGPTLTRKEISVKEFVIEKKASSDLDKTLAIAYYLERYKKVSPFSIRDLEESFRDAKEPLPKNISDAVNKNIAKGFIMPAKEKKNNLKAWTLTSSGERFVDNGLKEAR
jgi:hypothetical protein